MQLPANTYQKNNIAITDELEKDELRIVLVRHGQAAGNSLPDEIGPPLTSLGKRQAARVAKRLADEHFDHIYSSNMSRAYHTAQAIIKYHPYTPYTVDSDAGEVQRYHNLRGRISHTLQLRQTMAKERAAVDHFCRSLIKKHCRGQKIMIVAHGNFIRYFISVLADVNPKTTIPLDTYNASVTILTYSKNSYDFWNSPIRLGLVNCAKHLLPQQKTGI